MEKEEIKTFRQERNLTQKELADRIGVGEDYISKLERGVLPVTEKIIAALDEIKSLETVESEPEQENETATMEEVLEEADSKNKKGFSAALVLYGERYKKHMRDIELAKECQKSIIEIAKREGITKNMILSYCSVADLDNFNKEVLICAVREDYFNDDDPAEEEDESAEPEEITPEIDDETGEIITDE